MARTGLAAKGIIYLIIGILTFMAAINIGGQKSGKLKVLDFVEKQAFGNILLISIGLGLLCYAFWRIIQATKDPENIGNQKKDLIKRLGYFISGFIYLGFAVLAFLSAIGSFTGSSGSSSKKTSVFASDFGLIALGIIGVVIIGIGIYQFTRIKKDKFEKKFSTKALSEEKRRKTIYNSAYLGLAARGIIFLIIGFFAIKAAVSADPEKIKTTTDVFSFLETSSYGSWLLGIVALGLIAYAIYTLMLAKYRNFS